MSSILTQNFALIVVVGRSSFVSLSLKEIHRVFPQKHLVPV